MAAGAALAAFPVRAAPGGAAADPARLLPTTAAGLGQFIRMFASRNGKVAMANEGVIYGKLVDELPKPLFGFISVLEIEAKEIEPGLWRSEQKEAMACLDLATRMPLTSFVNPYTGETNTPLGYVSPTNVYYFDEHGSGMRERPKPGMTNRLWRSSATDVWVTESRYNNFPSSITEAEFPRAYAGPVRHSVDILTYRARAVDFANPALDAVPITLTMMSDTPWPLWMLMGKTGGSAFYHGSGQKYAALSDLPDISRRAIDIAYPGFLEDPWAYDSARFGTATQMRRLRAEGKL